MDVRENVVGKQIRKMRQALGLSQLALGQLTGCSQPQIARYETGVHVPTKRTLRDIWAVLQQEGTSDTQNP